VKAKLPCLYCGKKAKVGIRSCPECRRVMVLRIADRFDLLKCVSWGEAVYAFVAWDRQENQEVLLRAALNTASPEIANGLNTKAQVLLDLAGNPGIQAFVHGGKIRQTGGLYIAEEFVKGVSLDKAWTGLPANRRLELMQHAVATIVGLHDKGLVHGAIDPTQFVVCDDGRLVATDLRHVRRTGEKAGTSEATDFLAPEQLTPTNVVTPATDVYSLGACTYLGLTAKAPFGHKKKPSRRRALPSKPSEVCANITDDLDAVILRALAFDPASRFQSARELFEAIAMARGHDTIVDALPYTYPSILQRFVASLKEVSSLLANWVIGATHGVRACGRAVAGFTGLSTRVVYAGIASVVLAASAATVLLYAMPAPTVLWLILHRQTQQQNFAGVPAIPSIQGSGIPSFGAEAETPLRDPTIRFLTWPPSEVYLDGEYVAEAPSPEDFKVIPGLHSVKLVSTFGQRRAITFEVVPNCRYLLKFDFQSGTLQLDDEQP